MANEKCIYLVHSASDGVDWSKYIVRVLSQVGLDVKSVELDSSGSLPASFLKFRRGRVVVLLASPGFLQSLLAGQSSFDSIVNQKPAADSTNLVVLFLCGILIKDFEEVDNQGKRLSERFPGLNNWRIIAHEDLTQLPRTVCDLVEFTVQRKTKTHTAESQKNPQTSQNRKPRHKINFRLIPDEVRCEVRNIAYT